MSASKRQRRRRRHRGHAMRNAVLAVALVVVLGTGIGALAVASWVSSVADSAPSIDDLRPHNYGAVSEVLSADGHRLGFITSDVLRRPIAYRDMPQSMRDATIAIEDRRFYQHKGIDYTGILRAALANLQGGHDRQGGSTLTMQLIKNLYTPGDRTHRTLRNKIKEAKLAEQLERRHNKRWILASYLNSVPYGTVGGQSAYGVQAAARMFFGKPARRLTLAEAALLAGLPQAPSAYNPFRNPVAATARRNEVLDAMASAHLITPGQDAQAQAQPLGVRANTYFTHRREQFFFDYVTDELINRYGRDAVRRGGLKVTTTIELADQKQARSAIRGQLDQLGDPASAIVSIDPATGYIRAMASSEDYGTTQFNYAAQAHRQPGSAFKVMVLMAALRRGVSPESTYYESHHLEPGWLSTYPTYEVQTYSKSYLGSVDLVRATLQSDNTVYAQLDADLGPAQVTQSAHDLGIVSPLYNYPAEGLGGLRYGVSPLEMADAYATIASGGWRNRPIAITRVVHPDGTVDDLGRPQRVQTFEDGVTAEATKVLHENMLAGTGRAAHLQCDTDAGKTGTTTDFRDAWFVGYTPKLATAVWVGYPIPRPMRNVHGIEVAGATFPAKIWHDYMTKVIGRRCGSYPKPVKRFHAAPFFGRFAHGGTPVPLPLTPPAAAKPAPPANGTGGTGVPAQPTTPTQPPAQTQPPAPVTPARPHRAAPPPVTGGATDPGNYQSPTPSGGGGHGSGAVR